MYLSFFNFIRIISLYLSFSLSLFLSSPSDLFLISFERVSFMKAPFYSFNFIFFQSEITQESFRAFTAFLTARLLFPATINFISSAILKQKRAKRNINLDICSIFDIGILEGKKKEERGKFSDHGESGQTRCCCARKIYASTCSSKLVAPPEDSAATKRRGRNIERPGDLSGRWNWLFSGERERESPLWNVRSIG